MSAATSGLTTEERRHVRQTLMDMGFMRTSPENWDVNKHLDRGDGAYVEEWWGPGNTRIELTWRPKSEDSVPR